MANFYYPVDVEGACTQWCQLNRTQSGNFFVSGQAHLGRVNLTEVKASLIAIANSVSMPSDWREYTTWEADFPGKLPKCLRYATPEETREILGTPASGISPALEQKKL